MADKKTDKCQYESQYGGGWITAAQRLAELACERKASLKDETLNPLFWKNEPWTAQFRQQITHANRLLKEFEVAAILAALRNPQARKVHSLGAPFFKPLIIMEQHRLSIRQQRVDNSPIPEAANTNELPRPRTKVGRSTREKLSDL